MKIIKRITTWLEICASTPAYGGWILVGIAICFFGAGINTMAGWLYNKQRALPGESKVTCTDCT